MNFVDYLFETSRVRNGHAVIEKEGSISYQELYREVRDLSSWLCQEVGERQNIILISENSHFFVLAYLGIIKSGNTCVPVNPGTSLENLENILRQCQARLGFIQEKHREKFVHLFESVIDEPMTAALPVVGDSNGSLEPFDPARIAEILFTSGSTAEPKGVMLSHRNLFANTHSIIEYLHLSHKDRILAVLPFYYCYGLSLLHTHLRVGGTVVLNNSFMMVNSVIEDLVTHECSGFAGVPSHFQILLRKTRRFKQGDFPHLRYVTQAGGKLPVTFIKEFTDSFPEIQFFVMYGQTEATARLSYLPPHLLSEKLGSIGKGIPGVCLEVLNPEGKPVLPGEVGEVVADGNNVMEGYFNDLELTRQTIRNGKLYTGDLGTVDVDGYIFIVARQKEFLKVGGERISPKEIEAVIVQLPEVVDCSIIGVPDDYQGEAIKALVVLAKDAHLDKRQIVNHCNKHLSASKIPTHVAFIDHIPVSDTGKRVKALLQKY